MSIVGTFLTLPQRQFSGANQTFKFLLKRPLRPALLPFVAGAANDWIEPKVTDAAPRSNGSNARQSGHSARARYAYS